VTLQKDSSAGQDSAGNMELV